MHQNVFFCLAIALVLIAASPAEMNSRHRRHHKHHRKSPKISGSSLNEAHKRTLPPNIWALYKNASDDENGSKYRDDMNPSHDANENIIVNDATDFEQSDHDESIKQVAANCPKCNSVKMSENELANLRTEYVKTQILHKLRMTERPAPISKDELPEPISEGYAIQGDDDTDYLNKHLDDYYAKTSAKIIFLSRGESYSVVKFGLLHYANVEPKQFTQQHRIIVT